MIPVLGVAILNRPELLDALVASIDCPVGRVAIVDNGDIVGDISVGRATETKIIRPGWNLGCGASWNLIIKSTPIAPWWLITNHDITFGPGTLAKLEATVDPNAAAIYYLLGFAAFAITPKTIERVGWFDENFHPAYCLAPETPVLTADLRWVPIETLRPGDALVGVEEESVGHGRRFTPTAVTDIWERAATTLEIVLEDGRELICTPEHRWLARPPARTNRWEWREASELRPGAWLAAPLDTWDEGNSFAEGWMAGILDGEGTLHHTSRMSGISVAQKEGPVLDQIRRTLDVMRIPYTWRVRPPNGSGSVVANIEISSRRKAMELIGRTRSVRLNRPELWAGRSTRSHLYPQATRITSIRPRGTQAVIDISTTSKTFIANGVISHNCEDIDYERRCRIAGVSLIQVEGAEVGHVGSATIYSDRNYMAQNGRTYSENVRYYEAKWGGRMHTGETLDSAFGRGHEPVVDINRLRDQAWLRTRQEV